MKYFKDVNGTMEHDRVFSLRNYEGQILLTDECDGCFTTYHTKDEAIELFQEAIEWVKKQTLENKQGE